MRLKAHTLLMITSFVPVIAFKVIARTGAADLRHARGAAVVGLMLAAVQYVFSRMLMKRTTYLERAFLAFLAFAAIWVYIMPARAELFVTHSTTLLYGVLFLTTLLPQAFGFDPFTYAIHGFKAVILKDGGFAAIQFDLFFLFVFGIGTLLIATPLFKRTL